MYFRSPRMSLAAVLAAILALSFTSCNKLKLGYEYADWLVTYSVEDNFDLDKPQRAMLKEEVNAYFHWHRRQILPIYAEFATWVADSARNGIKPAEVDSGYARYRILHRKTMEPVVDKAVNLLVTLTPEQVDQWLERVRKKNAKLRKSFSGSPEERLAHRYGKIVDELEDWTGKLTKEQKARIKAMNRSLPWNGDYYLELRETVQDRLADMLKKKAPKEEVRNYLSEYFLETESLKSAEYKAKSREFGTRMRTMVHQVYNVLTSEQKRRFIHQVEKLAQDFQVLSQQE